MKIRMKGNSVRLRLTQGEIKQFATVGIVKQQVNFGATKLTYQLLKSNFGEQLTAVFTYGTISVFMPHQLAEKWVSTDLVGHHTKILLGNNSTEELLVLVEKDFQCLEVRPNEEDADAFPNPLAK